MVQLHGEDVLTALPTFPSRQSNTIIDHHPSLIRKRPLHRRIAMGIRDGWKYVATHRVFRIPKLNWLIMFLLGAFLVKLVLSFSRLYQRQALLTMLISNLLLYGLADTLAQTLVSILQFVPAKNDPHAIKFVLERQASDQLNLEQQEQLGADDDYYEDGVDDSEDLVELGLVYDDDEFRDIDRHISGSSITVPPGNTKATSIMHLVPPPVNFDFRRLSLFMIWGAVQAFLQYGWYAILNDIYSEDNLFLSALKRVLSDQLCYSPLSLAAFFTYMTIVIDGGDWAAVKQRLRTRYLQTLVVNYAVWPTAQFINFLLLPSSLQVPFASTIGVFWNAYLSLKNAGGNR